jgi:hypothetical protein
MATYFCYECDEEVNSAIALVRSVNFEQVAFHRECWTTYAADLAAVPQPRLSTESVEHQSA